MANTVHTYSPTAWTNGSTPISQTNLNHLETQASAALAGVNPDLITAAFILSGVAAVKDATTASQLNVTAGEAYLVMSDGTLARIDVAATNFSSSGHPSATLYLDLNPDGSWSFATTHSASAHYLPICQVATDASSNISVVTDKRVMLVSLLGGAAHSSVGQPGGALLPAPLSVLTTQNAGLAATVNGGVTFGQAGPLRGSMDTAALFNGTSGYLSAPTSGLPTGNSAFTLEGWFKTSVTGVFQFIIGMGGSTAKTGGFLYINNGNKLTGDLFNSNIQSGATYTDGAWHHAAFTWDGTTGILYADGAQVATSATLGPDNISYGVVTIGAQFVSSYSNFMNGALDECAIYNTALSAARITAHYNAGLSTTSDAYATTVLADSPVRYYRLGDAVGATSAAHTTSATQQTLVDAAGTLKAIGGQATAGVLGAPVIVAQALDTHVTTTGDVTLLTYAVQATGLYEINGAANFGNASGETVTFRAVWTDPHAGGAATAYFQYVGSQAGPPTAPFSLNGSNTLGPAQSVATLPITVYANSGTNIIVHWNDPAGTPNDYVSVLVKRLS